MICIDLQRFADTGGADSGAGGQAGLPAVDTVLGGTEGTTQTGTGDTGTADAGTSDNGTGNAGTGAPDTYDFSGVLQEVFGDGADLDADISSQFTDILHGLNATRNRQQQRPNLVWNMPKAQPRQ